MDEFKLGYVYTPSLRGDMQSGQYRWQGFIDKSALIVAYDSTAPIQQLLVINRPRRRAPNLTTLGRFLLGFWSLFLNPHRVQSAAVIIRPSMFPKFHNILKKRKYRLLNSSRQLLN
jgi:hypothetical protein